MADTQMIRQPDVLAPPLALATIDRGFLAVAEVTARVRRVQEIMRDLMIRDTHYGQIPGTPKPTLYQPGAEMLCVTFRIAPVPAVEDLSTTDAIRYRVTLRGVSQTSGEMLGEGVGECSSDETKYRWMRPTCEEEWQETPVELRREKWLRGKNGNYKAKQIRTSPADIANTVLKMAYKRALIGMTKAVLACSDMFTQDLDDLPEELRETVIAAENGHAKKPPIQPPQRKAAPVPAVVDIVTAPREPGDEPPDAGQEAPAHTNGGPLISDKQRKRLYAIAKSKGWSDDGMRAHLAALGFTHSDQVTTAAYDDVVSSFEQGPR